MKIAKTLLALPATIIGAIGLGLLFAVLAVKIYSKRIVKV